MIRGERQRIFAGIAALWLAWQVPCAAGQTTDAERELGRRSSFEAGAQLPLVWDPEVLGLVRGTGQRVVDALGAQPFAYHFFVVRESKLNAFALPGGYVYVYSGLIAAAENEDELAGVLAHEIAHVNAHHLLRQQEKSTLWNYARIVGLLASLVQPTIGAAALGASASAQLQYRREFEQEADYLGARYMQNAGYAPRGMLDFFQKLESRQSAGSAVAPPYLLRHPLTQERLTRLEAVLRTLPGAAGAAAKPEAGRALRRARLLARVQTEPTRDVLPAYQQRVAERPTDAEARYELGWVMLETGGYESARQTLEQARDMGYTGIERELGRAHLRLRQPQQARPLLARAVELNPGDALAQFEYGRVLEELGETDAAIAAYQRAVAAAPDLEEAQRQLGLLAGRTGDVGAGHYHLGRAYLLRGEYGSALAQYEKAATLLPPGAEQVDVSEALPQLREYASRH